MERDQLRPRLTLEATELEGSLHLCGFGVIAAAARTALLIGRHRPHRVLLVGIAGTLDPEQLPIGSARHFERVTCDGIGVGCGDQFVSAASLGWPQVEGVPLENRTDSGPQNVGNEQVIHGDVIPLAAPAGPAKDSAGLLLTCCAASSNSHDADARRVRFPQATAEDMEGFGVALACVLAGVPLQIVRGISNQVGDRDHSNWQIEPALASAAHLANELIRENWLPSSSSSPLSETDRHHA